MAKPAGRKPKAARKPRKPTSGTKPTSAMHAATKAAKAAFKTAAKMAGAKFGGIFKRKPSKGVHTMASADYREKPYFKRPRVIAKPSLSLEKLYNGAAAPDIHTARHVRLKTLKEIPMPKPLAKVYKDFLAYRATTHTDVNGHDHEIFVAYEPNENGLLTPKSKVVISCSCSRFKYAAEYKLAVRGASFFLYSNGQPPTVLFIPSTLCKHTIRTLGYLLRKRSHRSHDASDVKGKQVSRSKARVPRAKVEVPPTPNTKGKVKK